MDAATATRDLDILVNKKKEVNTERISVMTKFFKSKVFMNLGKWINENIKLSHVKNPKMSPSYILIPRF